ncbi:MAG: RNA polymerase sigma factor [Clostridia bacterium]|nr:RNA polymerase sigma factor [Clostridia bacterium]
MDKGQDYYERYLKDDEDALIDILREYRDGLVLYINTYVRNMSLAEEIALDTFTKLTIKRPRFHGEGSFKTWLYSIGRNLALDTLRKQKNHVPLDEVESVITADSLIEEEYLRSEKNAAVRRCMHKLKPEHTQALWLVYFENFAYADAAKVMKKTRRQFDSLIFRARTSLKSELEKEGFTYDEL